MDLPSVSLSSLFSHPARGSGQTLRLIHITYLSQNLLHSTAQIQAVTFLPEVKSASRPPPPRPHCPDSVPTDEN